MCNKTKELQTRRLMALIEENGQFPTTLASLAKEIAVTPQYAGRLLASGVRNGTLKKSCDPSEISPVAAAWYVIGKPSIYYIMAKYAKKGEKK